MMMQKVEKIVDLINARTGSWYHLKAEFKETLGDKKFQEIIDDFESQLSMFPKNKLPHYCLIFYLALSIITSEDIEKGELAQCLIRKKSYHLMKMGLQIFLSSRSKQLKYEAELTDSRYQNKYKYACFFSGFVPRYEVELRGYILLLEIIYEEDRKNFWKLLSSDKQNVIFLCILLNNRCLYLYEELVPFLVSEDKIKANGAFYYIMRRFLYLIRIDQTNYNKENQQYITKEIQILTDIFRGIPQENKISLIMNYLFEERSYPSFFALEIQQANIELIESVLREQNLNDLRNLVRIHEIIKISKKIEIEEIFANYFLDWVRNNGNFYIWENNKGAVKEVVQLLHCSIKEKLIKRVTSYKDKLYISSFDRQVRHVLFGQAKEKMNIVEEFLEWLVE